MIFWPEYAEDIIHEYVVNQIFESVSEVLKKTKKQKTNIKKDRPSTYGIVFVCISSCSVDKNDACCCFSVNKVKIFKNASCIITVFGLAKYWKHTCFFVFCFCLFVCLFFFCFVFCFVFFVCFCSFCLLFVLILIVMLPMLSWKLSVLEIRLDKELTANCLVEPCTKLEEPIPAAMVTYDPISVQFPLWLQQSLNNGFSWYGLSWATVVSERSVKCADEVAWNYKSGGVVHWKSPVFFFLISGPGKESLVHYDSKVQLMHPGVC